MYVKHIFRSITLFHGHDKHLKDNRRCGTFEALSVSHSAALLLATYDVHFSQATQKHVEPRIILRVLQLIDIYDKHICVAWSYNSYVLKTTQR